MKDGKQMAQSKRTEREALEHESEVQRERLGAAGEELRVRFGPGELARRTARRLEWRDVADAMIIAGRTMRDNPAATLMAVGGLGWLAAQSRSASREGLPAADLVLIPDPDEAHGAAGLLADRRSGADEARDARGRDADRPSQIPARGWLDILKRVWSQMGEDNISIVAAGVAFYAMLAIFPALGAALSIYGLIADPADVSQQLASLGGMLPADARSLLEDQLAGLAAQPKTALGFGVIFGILLALWSASAGMKALMTALNIAYEEEEKRGFLRYYMVALGLTFGAILAALVAIALVAVLPPILDALPVPDWLQWLLSLVRWPLLAAGVIFGLAVLYRHGPSRKQAQWQWVSWGAAVATVLWIGGSLLFSWYAANFADYNKTYGSVGAVVGLLMWFYITAYVMLFGAELNSEMERQTARDTTRAPEQPMGRRGARMADTVAA